MEEAGGDREMMEMKGCCLVVALLSSLVSGLDGEVTSILEKLGGSGGATGGGLSWHREEMDVEFSGGGASVVVVADGCSSSWLVSLKLMIRLCSVRDDLGDTGGLSIRESSGLVGLGRMFDRLPVGSGGGGAFGLGGLSTGAFGFSLGDG